MIRSDLWLRRTAKLATMLIVGLLVIPLASVGITAGWEAWRLRAYDNYSTSTAIMELVEARSPTEWITSTSIFPSTLPGCDTDPGHLPDWMEGEHRNWATWGPSDALFKLSLLLTLHIERLNGRSALQARYIYDHTTDFERRFLTGCVGGTLFAPICATRVKALMAAADASPVPPDLKLRVADLESWNQKVLCAFAKGVSVAKPSPSAPKIAL